MSAQRVDPHFLERWNDRAEYQLTEKEKALDTWRYATPLPSEPFDIDGTARWWADANVILVRVGPALVTVLTPRQAIQRATESRP